MEGYKIFFWFFGIAFCEIITAEAESSLYNVVSLLKKFDRSLNGRSLLKKQLVNSGGSKCDLLQFADKFKSNGTAFTSAGTSDWILEIIEGFESIKVKEDKEEDYSKHKICNFFTNINGSKDTAKKEMVFEMNIVGPLQHSWIIHRLPDHRGYRIYQSVTNAYSLNAWLSTDETPLEDLWSQGDLIYWQDIYNKVEGFLNLTGNTLEHLEDIKPSMLWMKPWLSFVKGLNQTVINSYFKKAWSRYGGGKVISEDNFFTEYLVILSNMTSLIHPLVGTTKIWTSYLDSQWISLFGAANPLVYAGMPFQMMTHRKNPKPFKLLVRQIDIDDAMLNIMDINAKKLLQSVNFTVTSFHKRTSSARANYSMLVIIICLLFFNL